MFALTPVPSLTNTQREARRHKTRAVILFLLAAFLWPQSSALAQLKTVRRVLILNDIGSLAAPGIARMDQAIYAGLQDSPYQIEIYNESLETNLFSDETLQREIRDSFIRRYEARKPDLVMTVGPASLKFMLDSHEKSFPNVPVIFCGGTEEMLGDSKLASYFTGTFAVADPEATLNIALRLQPKTRNVVIVGGAGAFETDLVNIVRKSLHSYESKLRFTYLTGLDMPTTLSRLRQLERDTVVLNTSFMQDSAGNRFIDATQAVPMIAGASNAPVFVLADVEVGNGAAGGYVMSWDAQGRTAAEMAVRVLNGENPRNIPVTKAPNLYVFDLKTLQRWGLRESELPSGSTLLNSQTSALRTYRWYIIAALTLILMQALLIVEMLWLRARRRKVEAELKKSEEKFSKAFRHSPLSITIATANDGRYIDVNDTFEQMTGWRRQDVVGRSPLDLRLWADPLAKIAMGKRLLAGEVIRNVERKFLTKAGEVRTSLTSAELIEVHGEPCVLVVKADITDLKRAEATLRESEERFRLVANTAPVMIWMSGVDKLCTYVNQTWLEFSGRRVDAELGNGWIEGVHPDDRTRCRHSYLKAFDRREPFQVEYRLRRSDGEYRWVIDSGVPRFNADGAFAGYIGSAIDVTERKFAEEALSMVSRKLIEAHEEERAWLARELHDDISQRLSLLVMQLGQLKHSIQASVEDFRDGVAKAMQQAASLGTDMQALSHRLHSSKLEYLGLAAAAAGYCSELADQHKVEINLQSENIPNDLAQEISLCVFRVLQEALQNAVKHSGARRFRVSLTTMSGEIVLTVEDSGKGFDAREAIRGRGLGLTSMRERLKLVGGDLSIESQLDIGTKIRVRVPFGSKAKSALLAG